MVGGLQGLDQVGAGAGDPGADGADRAAHHLGRLGVGQPDELGEAAGLEARGHEDRVGFSVVLVGEKVRKATSEDDPEDIIGIVSADPSVTFPAGPAT